MEKIFAFLNRYVFGPALPFIIFICGFILLICYGRYFVFHPKKTLAVYTKKSENKGISPLKSMILALASTLGVGNIVGVSTAIMAGGPGAVFWMTVSAFVAMPLKYGEVFLAIKTRRKRGNEFYGGAPYYFEEKMHSRVFGIFFAILLIMNALTVGNIIQINAVSTSFESVFGKGKLFIGIIFAFVVFLILKNGTKKITDLNALILPFATALYIAVSLYIVVKNSGELYGVTKNIIGYAFSFRSAFGGVCGYGISSAMRFGVARGIMSNEAGSGTSPTAHAKSDTDSPVKQGIWGIFEVFADTVIMCNLTAYVILLSYPQGFPAEFDSGMELVISAYGQQIGGVAKYFIFGAVLFFAFSTVVCQGVYGREGMIYIFGKGKAEKYFVVLFSLCCIYSAIANQGLIWELTDFNVGLMTVLNTVVVMFCSGEICKGTKMFYDRTVI